ncbi:glutamyl-tRNA amidotransferase [Thioclava sp. SK-1]|uniref:GatB/YqeY domain-containing protein n=1 Tax=Thioclava sp. SK-1 TaxID=1889770 RepID=UPI000824B32A|nr:GatB/YqeY domain-containing protein [Thioclava sp. SK-1]OCX64680.1 glutamyl-tRNA amidotransferase [Thioclava sp. SK-1]
MEMRAKIAAALKTAMRDKDKMRLSTLRLVNAAIKDREIAMRSESDAPEVGDAEVLAILGKMVKQRQESARAYEEAGRLELSEKERSEISVIEDYLPRQLSEAEVEAAVDAAIAAVGATSIRDMGRVMGELKSRYTGQMDFSKVGPIVKTRLGFVAQNG